MEQEVDRRAAEAFYRFGIGNTSGATNFNELRNEIYFVD